MARLYILSGTESSMDGIHIEPEKVHLLFVCNRNVWLEREREERRRKKNMCNRIALLEDG